MNCSKVEALLTAFLAGELDDKTKNQVENHIDNCQNCAKVLTDIREVTEDIKSLPFEATPSDTETAIFAKLEPARRDHRPKPTVRRVWIPVGAILWLILIVGFIVMKQQPLTAGQILNQAENNRSKLTSWYIKSMTSGVQSDGSTKNFYGQQWYQAPDKQRSEGWSEEDTNVYPYIINGNILTDWFKNGYVYQYPISDYHKNVVERLSGLVPGHPQTHMLHRIHQEGRIIGTQHIKGMFCDVVEADFETSEGTSDGTNKPAVLRIWIDRNTGMQVRLVQERNGKIFYREDLLEMQINQPIPDNVFAGDLPEDRFIIKGPLSTFMEKSSGYPDNLKDPKETGDSIRETIKTRMKKAPLLNSPGLIDYDWLSTFPAMYEPTYIPEGYKLLYAGLFEHLHEDREPYASIHIECVNPDTGDTIVMVYSGEEQEERITKRSAVDADVKEMDIDGISGTILRSNEPYPYAFMSWENDGTFFSLFASNPDEAEMLKIAQSIRRMEGVDRK